MQDSWHKKVVKECGQEVVKAAATAIVGALVFSLVYFILGKGLGVHPIHLSTPTLTLRILSGLVFDSLGYVLYQLGFYYALYVVMVVLLRIKKADYNKAKKIVWYLLMFIVGYYIVPWFIGVLSFIFTVIYYACVYVVPPVGIFAALFFSTFYFLKTRSKKEPEILQ